MSIVVNNKLEQSSPRFFLFRISRFIIENSKALCLFALVAKQIKVKPVNAESCVISMENYRDSCDLRNTSLKNIPSEVNPTCLFPIDCRDHTGFVRPKLLYLGLTTIDLTTAHRLGSSISSDKKIFKLKLNTYY